MTRRKLLRALLFLGLATVVLVLWWRPARLRRVIARVLTPEIDVASPTGALSDGELENLVACGEVLVEGRTLSTTERKHFIEYLDERTRTTPGYLSLYRMTASHLDRLAGARFARLDLPARARVLVRHRLTWYDVRVREYLLPFRRRELAVRVLAVPDLIRGYYRSPAGWAVVRYGAFPGRCSDLTRYTLPEA